MKPTFIFFFLLFFSVATCLAADRPVLNGKDDEINYSVGHQVGRDLVRQQVKVNPEVLLQGILDATSGQEPLLDFEKMINTLADLRDKIVKLSEQQQIASRRDGEEFLQENSKKEGVVTLPSGLQYKILRAGDGKTPTAGNTVQVNYTGQDIHGRKFDSTLRNSVKTPVEFNVDSVILGWAEALKMMPVGSEWELYIPHFLAFKDVGPLAGQTVIYQLELLKVTP